MIVRSVEVNQIVTKLLEIPQGGGRSIDELTVRSGKRKATFQNQIGITWFDSRFLETPIPFCAIIALKNCFYRTRLRSGAKKRFVSPLAEQQLERADNDRFAGPGFAGDRSESRRNLPFQILDQREILDS